MKAEHAAARAGLHGSTPSDQSTLEDAAMFELAPVPLWLEDYSDLKRLFGRWRAGGIVDLRSFLLGDRSRIEACSANIKVLKVNRATLELFEARDIEHLVANLGAIFRNDMFRSYVDELVQMWDGHLGFSSTTVNYSLTGRRIDIQLKGSILPGHEQDWARILVATENVTEREKALRMAEASDAQARGLFEHSPVSLWVEDFSSVKRLLDDLRLRGIEDFRVFTDVHPEFVYRCMAEIRVIDVNQHTLDLLGAPDKPTLYRRISDVFRDQMHAAFREQLVDLWSGRLFQQREVVNYSLNGTELHLHMQFSVLPGYENDWSQVQVALTDITARKKAEAYLEYLGKHDVLTRLYNRSFYVDELSQLERKGVFPITVIIIDLDGLKQANDTGGHAAGDGLLRRAAEVLSKAADPNGRVARIGGDEFSIILPHVDERDGQSVVENVKELLLLNNQFHAPVQLSLSLGAATSMPGERLEEVARRADLAMYRAKRAHYEATGNDRRR